MQLTRLAPEHIPALKPFFSMQPFEHSVFSLASVVAWRNEDGFSIYFTIKGDTLYLVAKNARQPQASYLGLPLPCDQFPPATLLKLACRMECASYNFIPEKYVTRHGRRIIEQYFDIEEHLRYRDYIYRTNDLAHLTGRKYAKKRNLIHQFETRYILSHRVSVELIKEETIPECLDFISQWYRSAKNEASRKKRDDEKAAIATFEDFTQLELTGIAIRIDGEMRAAATCAPLSATMGVLNLAVADSKLKGLYQYLFREAARRLFLGRFEYINKESDMGIPGLRQAKRSYHPVKFERCFRLIAKKL